MVKWKNGKWKHGKNGKLKNGKMEIVGTVRYRMAPYGTIWYHYGTIKYLMVP